MFIIRRLSRLSRTIKYALVAAAAFAIGSATVAAASTAGIPVGSLFYLPMINGTATTPCSSANGPAGATTTCNAIVDSSGNLHVSGTSTVSGSVGVNNFPADQQVHGTVGVNNLPADQQVHGNVGITNLPADQQIHGMVGINNFPSTQSVNGTVNVGNLPSKQEITGTVNVGNLPATQNVKIVGGSASAPPAATRVVKIFGVIGSNQFADYAINMKVTYVIIAGCDRYRFYLSGADADNRFDITTSGSLAFPVPMDVTTLRVWNENLTSGCEPLTYVMGY